MEDVPEEFELFNYKEISPSDHLLIKELEKNIRLGQWELAKGYIFTALSEGSVDLETISRVLRKIIENPHLARPCSPIQSKHHFNWLICQFLKSISKSQNQIDNLKRIAEFKILIHDVLSEKYHKEREELCNWFEENINPSETIVVASFSKDGLIVLKNLFLENPHQIDCILQELIIIDNLHKVTNVQIYMIYFQSLLHCIKQLKKFLTSPSLENDHKKKKLVEKTLCIIHLFPNIEEEIEREKLRELLYELAEICTGDIININDVYSALICKQSPFLLQMFCEQDDIFFNRSTFNYISSDKLFNMADSYFFREMFLHCIKQKVHFLDSLMTNASKLLLDGNMDKAWSLLRNSALNRLQPFILIITWQNCTSDISANHILDIIKTWKSDGYVDELFLELFRKLQYNLQITDWCIEKLRILHPNYDQTEFIHKRRNIFNQLLLQSPLRILHKTVGLSNISHDDVLNLLKYSHEEDYDCNKEHAGDLMLSSNSMVFHGYLVIMHIMDAIVTCCELEQLCSKSSNKRLSITHFCEDEIPKLSENIQTETSPQETNINELSIKDFVSKYGMQAAYSCFITERLQKTKTELDQIFPLSFRVEILEDIFSLLFVTSNDLQESTNYDSYEDIADDKQMEYQYECEHWDETSKEQILESNRNTSPCNAYKQLKNSMQSAATVKPKMSSYHKSNYLNKKFNHGIFKSGFLCNELIVRDILAMLKECYLSANSAIYRSMTEKQSENTSCDLERNTENSSTNFSNLSLYFKTSILESSVKQRLLELLKYINEAQWRFELVAADTVPREVGLCGNVLNKNTRISKFQKHESSVKTSNNEHLSSSSGKDEIKTKRKMHRTSFQKEKLLFSDSGFIHYMLASPIDLLNHSLWKQNYIQAKQVIQIFNLESSNDASEVYFAENFASTIKQIEYLSKEKMNLARKTCKNNFSTKEVISNSNKSTKGAKNLLELAEAADAGLQSTKITSIIDEMLSSTPLPNIPDSINIKEGQFLNNILDECKEMHAIVFADFAYTSNTTLDIRRTLLQTSRKRFRTSILSNFNLLEHKKRTPHLSVKGINKTAEKIEALLQEIENIQKSEYNFPSFLIPKIDLSCGFMFMLGSFDHKFYRDQVQNWKKFLDALTEMEQLLVKDKNETAQNKESIELQNQLHLTFKKLLKICSSQLKFLRINVLPARKQKFFNFLKMMYDHVQHVSNALVNCKHYDQNIVCSTNKSYFSVLNESPKDILSKMMLQNGISPMKLESFASEMKIHLVHLLAQNCFPHISATMKKHQLKCQNSSESSLIILNTCSEDLIESVRHPEVAVREILSDICNIIQDACIRSNTEGIVTMSLITSLIKEKEIKDWMMSTGEIAYIDISLLNTKEEKLAFFGNLCNIMWLHAIFSEIDTLHSKNEIIDMTKSTQIMNIQPEKQTHHIQILSSNIIERLIYQKICAYRVGKLHKISLFDLRYNILHAGLPIPIHIPSILSSKNLFESDDLLDIGSFGIEPRLLFVICEGFISSPKLQILYSETIIEQLDNAMRDYLSFHVETSIENEKVILPQLLNWYSQDFVNYDVEDLSQANNEGLLMLVSSYIIGDTENNLDSLLKLDSVHGYSEYIDSSGKKILSFSLEFEPYSYDFGIILDYDSIKKTSLIKNGATSEKVDYYKTSQQTHIIDYLKTKCWMLSDILAVMNHEHVASINKDSECKKLQAVNLIYDTPLKRLLFYSLELWKKCFEGDTFNNDISWFISALSPYFNQEFVWKFLKSSLEKKDFQTLLEYLTIVETTSQCNDYDLFKDIILSYLSSLKLEDTNHYAEPWSYALRIKNIKRKVNNILSSLQHWPGEVCLKILKACLADKRIKMENELYKKVYVKYEEISFCQKVIQASSRIIKLECHATSLKNWQDVAILSHENPKSIIENIRLAGQYQLAKEWEKIYPITKEVQEDLVEMHIAWLLDQNPPRMLEAEQVLHSLETPEIGLSLCYILLKRSNLCENKLFFVQYITENSKLPKNESDMESLKKLSIGLKILMLIKERVRHQYEHLAYYPHLLLEQLLMDMEIECFEKAIKMIYEFHNSKNVNDLLSPDNINELIETYANKALEIFIVEDFADLPSETDSSSTTTTSTTPLPIQTGKFSVPLSVPKKEDWIPDGQVRTCMVCQNEQFSMFNRRHHCRRCGRVVCKTCSQHRLQVEGYGSSFVRVCDECFEQIYSGNQSLSSSLEQRLRYHLSGSSPKQFYLQSREYSAKRRTSLTTPPEIEKLTTNESYNITIREEFFYEQAPSVSLCLSILALHSDVRKCSFYVLGLCNKYFNMLIPKKSGLPNPEIDYGLVISIIYSLLLNTKVKFSEASIAGGVEYVDTYLSFLDLIKQLVNENCVHLLPKDSITSSDAIRKLCDALRIKEKMKLALEISTKYSIDTFGIWATWGKNFLEMGDWLSAREKFSHCLKRPKDRNQNQHQNALLKEILSILERSKSPSTDKNLAIFKSITSLTSIQNGAISQVILNNDNLKDEILKECMYYLTNYGSHRSFIKFYQKHNMLSEAMNYIYKEQCDSEIFIENLFLPCAKLGTLPKLKNIICNLGMRNFSNLLMATCRYLEKNELYNLLYNLQLFMEDYIRAAMTSIKFYQESKKNFTNVKIHTVHLENAKKHLKMYLEIQKNDASVKSLKSHLLSFPTDKVKKYIRTIQVQIDLTEYFSNWESENELLYPVDIDSEKSSDTFPTVLGNTDEKIKVAVMCIINSEDIKTGINKSLIIIKEFSLNIVQVLNLAGISILKLKNLEKVLELIDYVDKNKIINESEKDDFISHCVEASSSTETFNILMRKISNDIKKINIYINCGKLKSAYLLAVKHNRTSDIQRIMITAEQSNQQSVVNICERWLSLKKD